MLFLQIYTFSGNLLTEDLRKEGGGGGGRETVFSLTSKSGQRSNNHRRSVPDVHVWVMRPVRLLSPSGFQ